LADLLEQGIIGPVPTDDQLKALVAAQTPNGMANLPPNTMTITNPAILAAAPSARVSQSGAPAATENPTACATCGYSPALVRLTYPAPLAISMPSSNVLVNNPTQDQPFSFFTQSETTNIAFGNTIVVGYNDSESFNFAGSSSKFTGFSVSTDGGNTFTDEGTLPTNPNGDLGDPVLARDNSTGTIYFATLAFSSFSGTPAIQVFRSTDGGNTFLAPTNAAPGLPSSDFPDKDWLTVDNFAGTGQHNVYVTFTDFGFHPTNLSFTKSTDGGGTWGPSGGTTLATGNVQGSYVTVGPDHTVYVFWLDGNNANERILMRKSTDQGATFAPAVTVATLLTHGTDGDLGLGGFRSNAFPHVAVNPVNGDLYVAYNDRTSGVDRANIYFTQSTDGGASWSSPVQVNDDATLTDQYQPVIAVKPNGTQLFMGWYDRRLDLNNFLIDTFGAVANVNTATHAVTFEPNFRITTQSFRPVFGVDFVVNSSYMGDYDTASADNTNFYFTWGDNRLQTTGGVFNPDVRFSRLLPDLEVAFSTPGAGDFVSSPPTDFIATLTDAVDPSSVTANDLTVDGITADTVSQTSANVIDFHFRTSPVTHEGPQTIAMAAGAVKRVGIGDGVLAYNATFFFDTRRLQESSTSPAAGSSINLPGNLIIHFNEAVDPTSVSTSNLVLSAGTVTAAAVVSGDPTSVDYTIAGPASLDGATLLVTLPQGALRDSDGNPGLGFSATFSANILVSPYPTPLVPESPPGSLIYDPSVSATIGFAGDTDSFTISLDSGQTASVRVSPDRNLQPSVALIAPDGTTVLGSASGGAAGMTAVLQTVPVTTPGTYTIRVSGANSTTGAFTAQLVLNSALQNERSATPPGSDDTIAGAQDLTNSFLDLGGGISRGAVLGQVPGGLVAGDVLVNERGPNDIAIYDNNGNLLGKITNRALQTGVISGVELGPDSTMYVGVDTRPGQGNGGELLHFDLGGNLLATIHLPNEPFGIGFFYPFGFDVAPDGTFWVPQPNSGNVIHTDASGNLIRSYSLGLSVPIPEDVAVRADGQVLIASTNAGRVQQLDPVSGAVTTFASVSVPVGLSFAASGGNGDLLVSDFSSGVRFFNSSGVQDKFIPVFGANHSEDDLSGNVFVPTVFAATLRKFDSAGNFLFSRSLAGNPTHLSVLGVDAPPPPAPDTSDYYSFTLTAGQSATIALTDLGSLRANLELEDGSGNVLAPSRSVNSNVNQVINNFVARFSGTYYVHVTGNGPKYTLVVTRGGDFDTENNNDAAHAQSLQGSSGALGFIAQHGSAAGGAVRVGYYTDFNTFDTGPAAPIIQDGFTPVQITDISTFNLSSINILMVDESNNGGLSSQLFNRLPDIQAFVQNGGIFVVHDRSVASGTSNPFLLGASSSVFVRDFTFCSDLDVIPPGNTLVTNGPNGTIDNNSLDGGNCSSHGYGLAATLPGSTVSILSNGPDVTHVAAFSYTLGAGGVYYSTIPLDFYLDHAGPPTLTHNMDAIYTPNVLDYAASLARPDEDWYGVSVNAGDHLTLSTATPAGDPQAPFEFHNQLNPALQLYDPSGVLVASDDNSAPDGKNALLSDTTLTTGTYHVRVYSANNSQGEYVLRVAGATGPRPPFDVTSTNPPANALLRSLPTITVDFNDSLYMPSVTASSLTVDGMAATGFTINNDHEVTWTLPALSGSGDDVAHTIAIAAGALSNIHGTSVDAFAETIFIDNLPPTVVATSIEEGAVLPIGSLTYQVTFSEPIVTAGVSASSFDLHGDFRNIHYTPTSFSFDATNTVLTIHYASLPDDRYTITLFSSAFKDRVLFRLDGEPHTPRPPSVPSGDGVEGGDFFVDFALDFGTVAYPTPLTSMDPAGSLIYDPTVTNVISFAGDTHGYTLNRDPGQTLTVVVMPGLGGLQATIAVANPSNVVIGSVTAAAAGSDAVLQTIPIPTGGVYTITVGGASSTMGLYTAQAILNAAVQNDLHGGPSNNTIATAQDLTSSFTALASGVSRGAVLGKVEGTIPAGPDAFGYEAIPVTSTFMDISGTGTPVLQGTDDSVFALGPSQLGTFQFNFYGTSYNNLFFSTNGLITFGSGNGEFFNQDLTFDPSQAAIAPFWDDLETFSNAGAVYWQVLGSGASQQLVLQWNQVRFFCCSGGTITFEAVLNEANNTIQFNYQNLTAGRSGHDEGASATVGIKDAGTQGGRRLLLAFDNGPNQFVGSNQSTLVGVGVAQSLTSDFYSFHLDAGQSVTLAVTGQTAILRPHVDLENGSGTVLAAGQVVNTNVNEVISNFVVSTAGTYYAHVSGTGAVYSLVVVRGAAFGVENNDDPAHAQNITGGNGVLADLTRPPTVTLGANFDGLNADNNAFTISPPDTTVAAGPNQVVEATNITLRVTDKAGNILQTQAFSTLFSSLGTSFLTDPQVVFDDTSGRFYVAILDVDFSFSFSDILLAVSNDSNPLDGFSEMHRIHVGPTDFLDFDKVGFNHDAVVITANDFFLGSFAVGLEVVAIDKSTILDQRNSTFTDFLSQRDSSHFRAMVPAQMHGAGAGGPMYFVEEAGYGNGQAARVVTMSGVLTASPTFTDNNITVPTYGFPPSALQPGGSVNTNDTTFTMADWRNGKLVSTQNVSEPDDGFSTARVRWYEFDTTGATPTLFQEGSIHPGPGISTYYGSAALDSQGDIGVTYMESSLTEFVSMYVTGRWASDPLGTLAAGTLVKAGNSFLYGLFRAGDYSNIALDPDGLTFWAANEYKGNSFWNTYVASFQASPRPADDWYRLSLPQDAILRLTTGTPGDGPGEFVNTLNPHIELYDAAGHLVATGAALSDGRNEQLAFAAHGGSYQIHVTGENFTVGEYFLGTTSSNLPAGLLLLDPSASGALTASGQASLLVGGGGKIVIDSSSSTAAINTGSGNVVATEIDVTGVPGISTSGKGTFVGTIRSGVALTPDPLASLPVPTAAATTFPAFNYTGSAPVTLQPGTYVGGIIISGQASVTLMPGLYFMQGGGFIFTGQGSLTGYGVMIYNAPARSTDVINLSGQGAVTLTALTDGAYADMTLFQARNSTNPITLVGNSAMNITGTIYAASAVINLSGNGGLIASDLIGKDMNVSGNGSFKVNARVMQLAASGNAGSGDASATSSVLINSAGDLLTSQVWLAVDNSLGNVTSDEQARIDAAVATLQADFSSYGLNLVEVTGADAAWADIHLHRAPTTDIGGVAQGVLGVTEGGDITIVSGWNFYAGADPTAIASDQYDFQTVVTHELGHAIGLGHSTDTASVMYPYLAPAAARHDLTANDLNNIQQVESGAEPLLALPVVKQIWARQELETSAQIRPDDSLSARGAPAPHSFKLPAGPSPVDVLPRLQQDNWLPSNLPVIDSFSSIFKSLDPLKPAFGAQPAQNRQLADAVFAEKGWASGLSKGIGLVAQAEDPEMLNPDAAAAVLTPPGDDSFLNSLELGDQWAAQ
jgi:hypothetical protein